MKNKLDTSFDISAEDPGKTGKPLVVEKEFIETSYGKMLQRIQKRIKRYPSKELL